ncbi:MAG TPA: diacylglycerol kinase family protein [Chthoniobacteraceae bacterium]|jgi:YegS/Rv2252/BmrU family lipid kinase|nr:diacylglycerol kinase family protein [Chthoniobacteraceae bacterium]
MPPILVIINPTARSERARALCRKIEHLSTRAYVRITNGPGEAQALAEQGVVEGFERIVAAGGDGTINEVVNGIAGSDAALGLLPLGTMNVFATELGLPVGNLRKCWDIIEHGQSRPVDLLRANDRHFVQMAGIGFDAQIVAATSFDFKKTLGPLSYIISATQIASKKPPLLNVRGGGGTRQGSFVLIGNGRYYGGPFVLFNEARVDDGLLDVLIFKNLGYLDIVRYLQAIMLGNHTALSDVEYFQTAQARVTSEEGVPVEVDGDVIGTLPVSFKVLPKRLHVMVP